MDGVFSGAVRTEARRERGLSFAGSRCSVEEDSWTEVERQELDHATSYVSDSMYLVMENPVGSLYMGEAVQFKVHALCDQSTLGQVGAQVDGKADEVMHGTLFLTSYRLLFRSFHHHEEELVEVHLSSIAELAEFRLNDKQGPMSQLEISCKNFELVKFNFPGETVSGDVYVRINQLLMSKLQPAAYAFARQPDTSGWAAYDPEAEFTRLDYYKDTNIMFMGIENIHSMRDSIRKLFDLIKNEVRGNERPNWLSCLESTRWLEHVRSILVSCSVCVAKLVEGTSLMIHCSDGWDRTAQIAALVKVCADPFYRTVKGFQVLIEQEWCAFGHQFRARSGHTNSQAAYWEDDSTSPVFMQFVDAVWQLLRQFPCSFEFNERYLIAMLDEVYCKRSGTFLHDCEEARMGSKTVVRCTSAWTLLQAHPQASDFLNPFYMVPLRGDGSTDRSPTVLQFKWHTSSLAIWTAFYLRSLESSDSRDAWAKELQVTQRDLQAKLSTAHQQLQCQVEQNSDLQSELDRLRRESAQLHRLLEGEVYSDTLNGLLVHQEDEDEDGVLLSVTPVAESRTTLRSTQSSPYNDYDAAVPGSNDSKVFSTSGVQAHLGKDGDMREWQGNEDGNLEECKLLSGDFAALLQVLLGFIALSVLIIKRLREVPRRPLMVWAFDASKQMIGASFAHVANMLIAIMLYSYEEQQKEDDAKVDQCALYFVNFTLDTTIGVFLNYVLLSAVVLLALRFHWTSLQTPGDYGIPVRIKAWLLQLLSWIIVIFSAKFIIAMLILAFDKPLSSLAMVLFKPLKNYPEVELALVMILCPCLMNAMQFWIQDNFLKKDVRDESFLVAQAAQSPAGSVCSDGLGTPTDDETSEPGDGDPKLTIVTSDSPEVKKKSLQLNLSSV
ncbi:hypothetical protein G195_008436 [Phytophthora kernoviae 00238/432]|uniref:Myotubularin phosphatase domain-containing protein n=1 Tax=Phytophthora kernoviae 00238/432 TaxID=1284355 RepID=A0A8J4S7C5_9STRA|nr:hypothetical protein G195_008436 [Phytophthora kernoviae 00238/432]